MIPYHSVGKYGKIVPWKVSFFSKCTSAINGIANYKVPFNVCTYSLRWEGSLLEKFVR